MATACLLSRESFLCPICLDVFTAPVTIPCGHNFCKHCIVKNWRLNEQCKCPVCNKNYYYPPQLHVNTFISGMAAEFRQSALIQEQPGAVRCDLCIGKNSKAIKSCVVCVASFCVAHLERHKVVPALRKHTLIDPLLNLEGRICKVHDELMELYCRTDETLVCRSCARSTEHDSHKVVPLVEESQEKITQLGKIQETFHEMVKDRQKKLLELQSSAFHSRISADKEMDRGVEWFAALSGAVHSAKGLFINALFDENTDTVKQRGDLIETMNLEIVDLARRNYEVKELLQSGDHLHLLRSFPAVTASLPEMDVASVSLPRLSYEGTLARCVSELKRNINDMSDVVLKAELDRVRQYEADITLDPDTAHCSLKLSKDGKQVSHADETRDHQDNKERFTSCVMVLAKQSFSSGRFYYEVDVKGKTKWDLGVARASANRRGPITACPDNGYWTMQMRDTNEYMALADPDVRLHVRSQPQRVGIFVDYNEGMVSFYDVTSTDLLFSFTGCSFNDKLHPFFSPCLSDGGDNSAPLVISPV